MKKTNKVYVHSVSGIFQKEMEKRLVKIPFVKVRSDIVIFRSKNAEGLEILKSVLGIIKENEIHLKFNVLQLQNTNLH